MSIAQHPEAAQRVGAVLDCRYRLEGLLGSGAMGAVYVGLGSNGHHYAVKLLLDPSYSRNPQLLQRFVREGRLASQLEAPNVAKVYELGVDSASSTPFIVMELLDGFDVEGLVERVGPVRPETAARIITQAARGVAVAHAAGIVHRDIKPANLFLHRVPTAYGSVPGRGAVCVKVCDFGIAKSLAEGASEQLTATGSLLGSPLFMSPEQLKSSKHVDPRTDVWSLGMTLWNLLGGRAAFGHVSSMSELMVSLVTNPIPWIQDSAPWLDPSFARVLHGTLLRELEARCPSMEALIAALAPFTGGTEQLTEEDLTSVPEHSRVSVAPRAAAVASWSDSISGITGNQQQAAIDPALSALVGRTLAGRYRLDRLLGAGGMGAVYQGVAQSGAKVAIKVILGEGEAKRPELLRRFVREAKSTVAIDSPNVVRVVDADTDQQQGFPFIVMDLLDGTDLDRLVKQSGALDPEVAVRIVSQASAGLAAAHQRSIVHRDIKPANLFLHTEADGRIRVKVCDFGIAKNIDTDAAASAELTRTGGMLGSPMYMSPEQARNAKHVDHTTDIWSLGVSLYEALSGRKPWDKATSVGEIIIAICTEEAPPLQTVAPWIDAALAEVVHRAMSRDPGKRYSSMEQFAQALAPFTGGSLELTSAQLQPISDQRRTFVAAKPALSGTNAALSRTSSDGEPVARSRKPLLIAAAITAFVAVGGGAAFLIKGRSDAATASAAAPNATTNAQPAAASNAAEPHHAERQAAKLEVSIKVTPKTSTVLVDGKPASNFADGVLTLGGEAGDRFELTVKSGDRSKKETVLIGKDGKPSVESIDLGVERAVAAGGGKSVPSSAPSAKVIASATPTPAPAAAPTPPAAAPAPTPAPAATPPAGPIGASSF